MSDRLVKCYGYCEQKHKKSVMEQISGKNYCPDCFAKIKKERHDRELLYKTICEIFKLEFPTGQMLKQIKQYKEERGYTYKNIALTLKYIKEHKNMEMYKGAGIAIVPHIYNEMLDYYRDLYKKRSTNVVEKVEPVKVTVSATQKKSSTNKNKKLINMEDLLK